jgi:hypothetical protein
MINSCAFDVLGPYPPPFTGQIELPAAPEPIPADAMEAMRALVALNRAALDHAHAAAESLTVYSVGADGVDDGGRRYDAMGQEFRGGTDIVFTVPLWPSQP